jgi:hypothetical protein
MEKNVIWTPFEALPAKLQRCEKAGRVPLILGARGIGKTQSMEAYSSATGRETLNFRLENHDPTDLSGINFPIKGEDGVTRTVPTASMVHFMAEESYKRTGKGPLIALDELTIVNATTLKSANKLLEGRDLYAFPPGTFIIGAGNTSDDNVGVVELPPTTVNRLTIIYLKPPKPETWVDYMLARGKHYLPTAFIKNVRPDLLHVEFWPNEGAGGMTKKAFWETYNDFSYAHPTHRSWEGVANLMDQSGEERDWDLIAGTIGFPVTMEFKGWADSVDELSPFDEIISDPEGCRIPRKPGCLFTQAALLVTKCTKKEEFTPLMKFVRRLPKDFQTLITQDLAKKLVAFANSSQRVEWIKDNQNILL